MIDSILVYKSKGDKDTAGPSRFHWHYTVLIGRIACTTLIAHPATLSHKLSTKRICNMSIRKYRA